MDVKSPLHKHLHTSTGNEIWRKVLNILWVYLSEVSGRKLYIITSISYTSYRLQISRAKEKGVSAITERGDSTIKVRTLKQYKCKYPSCTYATVKSRQKVSRKSSCKTVSSFFGVWDLSLASQNQVYMLKQRNSDWASLPVGSDKNTNSKTILSTVPSILYMTWNTFLELKRWMDILIKGRKKLTGYIYPDLCSGIWTGLKTKIRTCKVVILRTKDRFYLPPLIQSPALPPSIL